MPMQYKDETPKGRFATIERALKPNKPGPYPGLDLELKLFLGHVVVGLLHLALLVT